MAAAYCSSCGAGLSPATRVCEQCGHDVSSRPTALDACSECASLLRAGARFCTACGAAVPVETDDAPGESRDAASPEADRGGRVQSASEIASDVPPPAGEPDGPRAAGELAPGGPGAVTGELAANPPRLADGERAAGAPPPAPGAGRPLVPWAVGGEEADASTGERRLAVPRPPGGSGPATIANAPAVPSPPPAPPAALPTPPAVPPKAFVTYNALPLSRPPVDKPPPESTPAPQQSEPRAPEPVAAAPARIVSAPAAPAPSSPRREAAAPPREGWSTGWAVAIGVTVLLLGGSLVAALLLRGGDDPRPEPGAAVAASTPPAAPAARPAKPARTPALAGQVRSLDDLMKASQAGRDAAVEGDTDAAVANRTKLLKDLRRLSKNVSDAKLKAGLRDFTAAIQESLRQNRECGADCPTSALNKVNRLKQRAVRQLNPLLRKYAESSYRAREI